MHKSIFVSSTFKDFQRERDLLQTKVELRVNELLRNIQVSFLDLRWGIDTTGEKNLEKVVSICIAEVLNSRPFYVIMLGDTYGSCVDKAVVAPLYALNGLAYDGNEKSVTEIEIEATGLLEGNREYVLVLDRRTGNAPDPRAEALKQRVLKAADPQNVYVYTAVEQEGAFYPEDENGLVEFIARRLRDFLKGQSALKELPDITFAKEQAQQFCGRQSAAEELKQAVLAYTDGPLFRVYAPSGAGLTALLSHLFVQLQAEDAQTAFLSKTSDLPVCLAFAFQEIAVQWDIPFHSCGSFFHQLDPKKRYVCILDGMEELADDPILHTLLRLGHIPKNILFILSAADPTQAQFSLGYPTKEDVLLLFDSTFRGYRKEVPADFRKYFEAHIPEEMVRQPAFLKHFISALCYLKEEDYRSLSGSVDFALQLSLLFQSKLDSFPKNEQTYIDKTLSEAPEAQFWLLGLLAVASDSIEDRVLLGALRSQGIDVDLLQLRTVKEQFRHSVYCPDEHNYAITRGSFRTAVLSCFTELQQKWLRYLLVSFLGENPALYTHVDLFPEIVYQYLMLGDYELLARLLEQNCLMPKDGHTNGLRFSLLCGDYGADAPSPHYLALAAQNNPLCNRWLVKFAMPYITELYRQNGAQLFGDLYASLIRDGSDPANAADLFALYTHGLALQLRPSQAHHLTMQELEKGNLQMLTGGSMIQNYLAACMTYDTSAASYAIDFFLKDTDVSHEGVGEVLSHFLRLTVLMDGNALTYKPQLERLLAFSEKFLAEANYANPFAIALPLLYLSFWLDIPLQDGQKALDIVADRDLLMEQSISVQLLYYYHMPIGDIRWTELARLVAVITEEDVPLSSVDLFFVARYFRRLCYAQPEIFAPKQASHFAKKLYQRFWDVRGGVFAMMQFVEMTYLGCLVCLYEGESKALELMEQMLMLPTVKTEELLKELGYFRMDTDRLRKHLGKSAKRNLDRLEMTWTRRK